MGVTASLKKTAKKNRWNTRYVCSIYLRRSSTSGFVSSTCWCLCGNRASVETIMQWNTRYVCSIYLRRSSTSDFVSSTCWCLCGNHNAVEHNESVKKQSGPSNRDDLLTHRYVRQQERAIRRSTYELDSDDAVSISMWIESHQSHVFFYEDFSNSNPFTLGIQTEWQLQQMIRFGNHGLLASDSRFGTNKLKVCYFLFP
ncbi:hypothetical protein RIF29_26352 [Crotalaria pallida]|uniref:Uncharacterized protein n=1 Tax=Crotalaria pallida TaxID=3830 RepID=A0AAN9I4T0_CROPI